MSGVLTRNEKAPANGSAVETRVAKTKVQESDLLDLWKYFQDRADMLKERQWTVGTWILTLLSGNIALALSQEMVVLTQAGITISKPLPALLLGVVGMLTCLYGYYVLRSYRHHIQRNWDRAGEVKRRITDLDVFWKAGLVGHKSSGRSSSNEFISLIIVLVFFAVLYILMSLLSIIALLSIGANP